MATAVTSTVAAPWQSTAASVPVNPQASTLRRTTCDVCRERKVRCDRTKPECLRCRRSGSVCAYPSPDADAAKIQQTLQSLSKRLGESRLPLLAPPRPLPLIGISQKYLDCSHFYRGCREQASVSPASGTGCHAYFGLRRADDGLQYRRLSWLRVLGRGRA